MGSSRKISSGSCTSAEAIASRCRWPPERWSTRAPACRPARPRPAPRPRPPRSSAVQAGDRSQVLARGEPDEERGGLGLHAHPGQQGEVARPRGQAEDADRAGVGLPQPLHDLDQRGLARAVGAEEPEELAAAARQGHPVHGRPRRRSVWNSGQHDGRTGLGRQLMRSPLCVSRERRRPRQSTSSAMSPATAAELPTGTGDGAVGRAAASPATTTAATTATSEQPVAA